MNTIGNNSFPPNIGHTAKKPSNAREAFAAQFAQIRAQSAVTNVEKPKEAITQVQKQVFVQNIPNNIEAPKDTIPRKGMYLDIKV